MSEGCLLSSAGYCQGFSSYSYGGGGGGGFSNAYSAGLGGGGGMKHGRKPKLLPLRSNVSLINRWGNKYEQNEKMSQQWFCWTL